MTNRLYGTYEPGAGATCVRPRGQVFTREEFDSIAARYNTTVEGMDWYLIACGGCDHPRCGGAGQKTADGRAKVVGHHLVGAPKREPGIDPEYYLRFAETEVARAS